MTWMGRILGLIIGLLIMGPIGGIIGLAIGYFAYDKPKNQNRLDAINAQRAFTGASVSPQSHARLIAITFSLMGYVARGAGVINQSHINAAEKIMAIMMLSEERRQEAIDAFEYGKSKDFDLSLEISKLRELVGMNPQIYAYLLEIQIVTAIADGRLDDGEHERLHLIAMALGVDRNQMEKLIRIRLAEQQFAQFSQRYAESRRRTYEQRYGSGSYSTYGNRNYENYNNSGYDEDARDEEQEDHSSTTSSATKSDLENAYEILGVTRDTPWEDIKRAHRKLMLKYHPDRLASQGLPPELVKLYTQKAQDIQAAFSLIKASLGK